MTTKDIPPSPFCPTNSRCKETAESRKLNASCTAPSHGATIAAPARNGHPVHCIYDLACPSECYTEVDFVRGPTPTVPSRPSPGPGRPSGLSITEKTKSKINRSLVPTILVIFPEKPPLCRPALIAASPAAPPTIPESVDHIWAPAHLSTHLDAKEATSFANSGDPAGSGKWRHPPYKMHEPISASLTHRPA